MKNLFLFLAIHSFLFAHGVHAMEELSSFESEEEYVGFNFEKAKGECLKRGTALLGHIAQLKRQKAEFSLLEILPCALIEEIDELRKSERNFVSQIITLRSTEAIPKSAHLKKEPVIESDTPKKDQRELVEDRGSKASAYQNSENYIKSKFIGKRLVEVPYKIKHDYQMTGCYFKFTLLKKQKTRE